jgi:hypothetical protein
MLAFIRCITGWHSPQYYNGSLTWISTNVTNINFASIRFGTLKYICNTLYKSQHIPAVLGFLPYWVQKLACLVEKKKKRNSGPRARREWVPIHTWSHHTVRIFIFIFLTQMKGTFIAKRSTSTTPRPAVASLSGKGKHETTGARAKRTSTVGIQNGTIGRCSFLRGFGRKHVYQGGEGKERRSVPKIQHVGAPHVGSVAAKWQKWSIWVQRTCQSCTMLLCRLQRIIRTMAHDTCESCGRGDRSSLCAGWVAPDCLI